MRIAHGVVVMAALAGLGCTAHEQPAPEQVAKAEAKPEPVVEAKPEPTPEPVVEAEPEPEPEPQPKPPPPPDHAGSIEPEPGVTTWKEVPGLSAVSGFYPFVIGTLATCNIDGERYCKLYDDNRLEPTDVSLPYDQPVWGVWRSDAWTVELDGREEETDDDRAPIELYGILVVQRWRGTGFQTQKRFEFGMSSYSDTVELTGNHPEGPIFHKGWAGGMLVYDGGFIRLPESGPPAPSVSLPPNTVDFYEAESGAMFFVDDSLRFHPPCPLGTCADQAFKLPNNAQADGHWRLGVDVARGGDSMSIVIEDEDSGSYLLHYDAPEPGVAGRWTFERLPEQAETEVIWPDTRGGVFVGVGDALWYRSKDGRWFDVALPGKAIEFANRLKPREFLALVEGTEGNRVFATRGPIKAGPKPAPTP